MSEFENIRFERDGAVAVITLARPEKYNALSPQVWDELFECQRALRASRDVHAVLLRAEGKHFSSGLDLNCLVGKKAADVASELQKYQHLYYGWEQLGMPVIAAVQGKCLGNAAELLLSVDLRMAAASAKFAFLEVKFAGISPDMGGTAKLARLVGPGQAKRLMITGEQIGAKEAERIGLVEYVVEDEELDAAAMKLAQAIAAQPPIGVMSCKLGVNMALESSAQAAAYFERLQAMYCTSTADMQEAIAASMERRQPQYKGE